MKNYDKLFLRCDDNLKKQQDATNKKFKKNKNDIEKRLAKNFKFYSVCNLPQVFSCFFFFFVYYIFILKVQYIATLKKELPL